MKLTFEEIATWAAIRETSEEIAEAIIAIAQDEKDAQRIWNGCTAGEFVDIWERATNNGQLDDEDMLWGEETLGTLAKQMDE